MEKLIGIRQAAKILKVNPQTLRNWDNNGRLKAYRHPINNYRFYKKSELLELLNKIEGF